MHPRTVDLLQIRFVAILIEHHGMHDATRHVNQKCWRHDQVTLAIVSLEQQPHDLTHNDCNGSCHPHIA